MNQHIRRVAIAVGVLMVALFLNLNFVQVVKGDDYRNNPANRRVILTEYASPRGQIVVDGKADRRVGRDDRRAEVPAQVPERAGVRAADRLLLARLRQERAGEGRGQGAVRERSPPVRVSHR